MNNKQNSQTVLCPECDTPIQLPVIIVKGKIIECPACGCESELIETDPVRISPLEEEK